MNWAQLPRSGGLENQDPLFLDMVMYLEQRRAEHEASEAEKQKREASRKRR